MKKYEKPTTLKVNLAEDVCQKPGSGSGSGTNTADLCGVETTFNVSKKSKTTYKFCYHWPNSYGNYSSTDRAVKLCIGAGNSVEFVDKGTMSTGGKTYTGWADFSGTNGGCHYAGTIRINGTFYNNGNNIPSKYKCN